LASNRRVSKNRKVKGLILIYFFEVAFDLEKAEKSISSKAKLNKLYASISISNSRIKRLLNLPSNRQIKSKHCLSGKRKTLKIMVSDKGDFILRLKYRNIGLCKFFSCCLQLL
jgi:hypothetical protein